jgi:poly(3-hydroxybutyrate) depolymerase
VHYTTLDFYHRSAEAVNHGWDLGRHWSKHPLNPLSYTHVGKFAEAFFESGERLTRRYEKPKFGLDRVKIDGEDVFVNERIVARQPFCNLVHFERNGFEGPKVLLVAPLSGHHATLLRDTVRTFLPDHDVYLTDWLDARDIPLSVAPSFGFDDFVDTIDAFLEAVGPGVHLMAVCQPTVQAMIATARLAARNSPATPKTLTVLAGPVDTRIRETRYNLTAKKMGIDWYRRFAIYRVPYGYAGYEREVYPGAMQLASFMGLKPGRHLAKHWNFFWDVARKRNGEAEKHRTFYDDYMSVLDMDAQFYIETLERVFLDHHIPKGKARYRGEPVDFAAVEKTALMTLEGELDDICSPGQTEPAHEIFVNIPAHMREKRVEAGVGHYGIFSGTRFRNTIAPHIKAFMAKHRE